MRELEENLKRYLGVCFLIGFVKENSRNPKRVCLAEANKNRVKTLNTVLVSKIQGMKLTHRYLIFLAIISVGEAFRLPAFSGNLWGARVPTNLSTSRFGSKNEWVSVVKRKDLSPGDVIPVEVDGLALLLAVDLAGD